VIIPSIDLMDGKVVQLIQGKEKALEGGTPREMLTAFSAFPEIQVIDLDAALGRGNNYEIVAFLAGNARIRVGGGIRSVEKAMQLAELGAQKIIVGTAALRKDGINHSFLAPLADAVGRERILVALDSRKGQVVVEGWQVETELRAESILSGFESYCSGFLCTYVDREGTMQGTDLEWFRRLRNSTDLEITAAGGISTMEEILALRDLKIHVCLGMAIYTGRLSLDQLAALARDEENAQG
jgi:phosphoribosylformimino-5-aminoimidazole carboxamide ribotide isomerase